MFLQPLLSAHISAEQQRINEDRARRFAQVSESLRAIGALPLSRFADASSTQADFDTLFDAPNPHDRHIARISDLKPLGRGMGVELGGKPASAITMAKPAEDNTAGAKMQFVSQLHQTCISTFGNADALDFEFLEESGNPGSKKCILNINRPNGQSRSYTSEAAFSRKSDAKASAAAIAVELGAIDFILHGCKDVSKKQIKLVSLESLNAKKRAGDDMEEAVEKEKDKKDGESESESKESTPETEEVDEDDASREISLYCKEWRADAVRPQWLFFQQHKTDTTFGCVLLIELTPHCKKLFSVPPIFGSRSLAKKECSTEAIAQSIIDFIKHGNGQTKPATPTAKTLLDNLDASSGKDEKGDTPGDKGRKEALSLQSFFDSLPKPFPEEVKPDVEHVSAVGILNSTLQTAKGAKLTLDWYFINDHGLHGAIIRLHRPSETVTYVVEPKFTRRADAKSAVALQAMSEGACAYMRRLAKEVDEKITKTMRTFTSETILPILGSEYTKVRNGRHPEFAFEQESGAFGASLTLRLTDDPEPSEIRTWTIPAQYRTKNDAKIAVAYAYGREAILFLRFRGQTPPPDHDPFKTNKSEQKAAQLAKVNRKTEQLLQKQRQENGRAMLGENVAPKRHDDRYRDGSRDKGEGSSKKSSSRRGQGPQLQRYDEPRSNGRKPRKTWDASGNSTQVSAAASAIIDRVTGTSSGMRAPPTGPAAMVRSASKTPAHVPGHHAHSPPVTGPSPASYPPHPSTPLSAPPYPGQTSTPPSYPPYIPQYQYTPPPPSVSYPIAPAPYPYVGPVYPYAYPQAHAYPFPSSNPTPSVPPYGAGIPSQQQGVNAYPMYYPDPYQAQPQPQPPCSAPHWPANAPPSQAPLPDTMDYVGKGEEEVHARLSTPNSAAGPCTSSPSHQSHSHGESKSRPDSRAHNKENAETGRASPSNFKPNSNGVGATSNGLCSGPGPTSATRTVSFGSGAGKRPRSRESTPEEASPGTVHKKHRSESSLPSLNSRGSSGREKKNEEEILMSTSNFDQLLDYCKTRALSVPEFGYKPTRKSQSRDSRQEYKVWIFHGKEKLELPASVESLEDGRQRVSRLVLARLKKMRGEITS